MASSRTLVVNNTVSLREAEGIIRSMENAVSVLQLTGDNNAGQVYRNDLSNTEKAGKNRRENKISDCRNEEEMVSSSVLQATELIKYAQNIHEEEGYFHTSISLCEGDNHNFNNLDSTHRNQQQHDHSHSSSPRYGITSEESKNTPNRAQGIFNNDITSKISQVESKATVNRAFVESDPTVQCIYEQCDILHELNENLQSAMKYLDDNFTCYHEFASE